MEPDFNTGPTDPGEHEPSDEALHPAEELAALRAAITLIPGFDQDSKLELETADEFVARMRHRRHPRQDDSIR